MRRLATEFLNSSGHKEAQELDMQLLEPSLMPQLQFLSRVVRSAYELSQPSEFFDADLIAVIRMLFCGHIYYSLLVSVALDST